MPEHIEIAAEDPTTPVALDLVGRASAEQGALYDLDDGSSDFNPADVQVPRSVFLVARVDGRPVGCGAVRPMSEPGFEDSAEVKRMYLVPEARGRRIGGLILAHLEDLARDFGYGRIVLETGDLQPQAIRLYERAGYVRIPNYGPYVGFADSICFEKRLRPSERT